MIFSNTHPHFASPWHKASARRPGHRHITGFGPWLTPTQDLLACWLNPFLIDGHFSSCWPPLHHHRTRLCWLMFIEHVNALLLVRPYSILRLIIIWLHVTRDWRFGQALNRSPRRMLKCVSVWEPAWSEIAFLETSKLVMKYLFIAGMQWLQQHGTILQRNQEA